MELQELRDKLNKKHVKVRVPYIQGEAYAIRYARILKAFTDEVVENFSSLVKAIFDIWQGNSEAVPLSTFPRFKGQAPQKCDSALLEYTTKYIREII